MPRKNPSRPPVETMDASASPADPPAVPAADAASLALKPDPAKTPSLRQLAKDVAEANLSLASLAKQVDWLIQRMTLAESRLNMVEYQTKPAAPTSAPMPFYPQPYNPYDVEPWLPQVPTWRLDTVWCGDTNEQGKLSDCFK